MKHVTLVPINAEMLSLLEAGAAAFEAQFGVRLGDCLDFVMEPVRQTITLLGRAPRPDPWGCYLAADRDANQIIGTCGFKASPDAQRSVEIAYYTFPPFESQGYATAMALTMIDLARSSADVRLVLAHTLPEENASGSVLKKCGFRQAGEVIDPEDGLVWRWESPVI